jgi:hypothetical protein
MSGTHNLDGLKTQALTCIEAAYDKGYRAARLDASEYERGLDDAEKAIKRVLNAPSQGGLYANEMQEIFGTKGIVTVLLTHSMSEIIEKIREYDDKKEERNASPDSGLHIGDEICQTNSTHKYIVTAFLDNGGIFVLGDDGFTVVFTRDEIHKTGRNYPIKAILKELS